MKESQKYRFKIAVIGDSRVGKTSLMKKFTRGDFSKDHSKTTGANFSTFEKEIEGQGIRLIFWDIAGGDSFPIIRSAFYKNSGAAIIVFSLEDNEMGRESFNHIPNYQKNVMKYRGDIPVYLFANKVDLVDEDDSDDTYIKKIVEEYNIRGYYLTSATTGINVIKAFNEISEDLYNKHKTLPPHENFKKIEIKKRKKKYIERQSKNRD